MPGVQDLIAGALEGAHQEQDARPVEYIVMHPEDLHELCSQLHLEAASPGSDILTYQGYSIRSSNLIPRGTVYTMRAPEFMGTIPTTGRDVFREREEEFNIPPYMPRAISVPIQVMKPVDYIDIKFTIGEPTSRWSFLANGEVLPESDE